jgi:hypothetical protein
MPLIPSLKPTFSSVAILLVRKRTSRETSVAQLPGCVTTLPFLQRRLTVTAPDLQLPSQAPSPLEEERSFQRPYSFVFPGLVGTLVAINIASAVLSLMV